MIEGQKCADMLISKSFQGEKALFWTVTCEKKCGWEDGDLGGICPAEETEVSKGLRQKCDIPGKKAIYLGGQEEEQQKLRWQSCQGSISFVGLVFVLCKLGNY